MENGQEETQKPKPKRTAKDTVFTSLFREKEYLLRESEVVDIMLTLFSYKKVGR